MITITEAGHIQRKSGRKLDLMLYENDPFFSGNYFKKPECPTSKHASGIPQTLYSRGTVEFMDILGTIFEKIFTYHNTAKYASQVQKRTKWNNMVKERSTKLREIRRT